MRKLLKFLILLSSGGLTYVLIELLFRGRSHWSMFLVGGICFVLIGGLNNWVPLELVHPPADGYISRHCDGSRICFRHTAEPGPEMGCLGLQQYAF